MNAFQWHDLKQVITMVLAFTDLYKSDDPCSVAKGTYLAAPPVADASAAAEDSDCDIILEVGGGRHRLIVSRRDDGYVITAISGMGIETFIMVPSKNIVRVYLSGLRDEVELTFSQCCKKNWIITKFVQGACTQVSCVMMLSSPVLFQEHTAIYHMEKTDLPLPDSSFKIFDVNVFMKNIINMGMILSMYPTIKDRALSIETITDTTMIVHGDYGVVRYRHDAIGEVQLLVRRNGSDKYSITIIPENGTTVTHQLSNQPALNLTTLIHGQDTITIERLCHKHPQYSIRTNGHTQVRAILPENYRSDMPLEFLQYPG
jgi:hypothetical protein